MIDRFKNFIRENDLCRPGDRVMVALSGGVDSVVLLHLFIHAGYSVTAAHCNFKLRGDESDADEQMVRDLCTQWDIKLFVKSCPAKSYADTQKLTIQEAARDLRYDFFEKTARQYHFDKIAVAHHADDDLETFFINLFRGSGVQGLKGIPVKRDRIIRPLMFATRYEIEQYARQYKIPWREDSSNRSGKYLRNRIRHELLPLLEQLATGKAGLLSALRHLKDDAFMLDILLKEEQKKIIEQQGETIIIHPEKLSPSIPFSRLAYYLFKEYGFNEQDTKDILEARQHQATGKIFYSKDWRLVLDRKLLLIRPMQTKNHQKEYFLEQNVSSIDEPFQADITILDPSAIKKEALINKLEAFMDLEKLHFPLKIRKWQKGDRFQPYGMKGSKLLSDFFTDQKWSAFQKEDIWLMESGEEIVWIVGHRLADTVKITPETKQVFRISLQAL